VDLQIELRILGSPRRPRDKYDADYGRKSCHTHCVQNLGFPTLSLDVERNTTVGSATRLGSADGLQSEIEFPECASRRCSSLFPPVFCFLSPSPQTASALSRFSRSFHCFTGRGWFPDIGLLLLAVWSRVRFSSLWDCPG